MDNAVGVQLPFRRHELDAETSDAVRNREQKGMTCGPENLEDKRVTELFGKHGEIKLDSPTFRVTPAPHHLLPPEILASIFVLTLDDDRLTFPPKLSKSPWVLRRICSRWRRIAISEPLLWNNIDVQHYTSRFLELINHVTHPTSLLSVSINCYTGPSSRQAVDGLLIPQLTRVKHLKLLLEVGAFTKVLDMVPESFSSLESLRLDLWSTKSFSYDRHALVKKFPHAIGLQGSTRLKQIDLSCRGEILFSDAVLTLPFTWSHLTSVHLTKLQPLRLADVHRVLQQCHSLIDLLVAFYYRNDLGGAFNSPESLELPYVKHVELPHLKHVEFREYIPSPHSLLDLRLPWNRLTRLHLLQFSTLTLIEVCQILTLCAEIVDLSLSIDDDGDRFLPQYATTFPKLRNLNIRLWYSLVLNYFSAPVLDSLVIRGHSADLRDISNMVKRSGCSLSTFAFSASQTVDSGFLEELLVVLPSVTDFQLSDIELDPHILQAIAERVYLPDITSFACELRWTTLTPFADLVEMRSKEGKSPAGNIGPALRTAVGTYLIAGGDPWDAAGDASRRLRSLTKRLGTQFGIITRL